MYTYRFFIPDGVAFDHEADVVIEFDYSARWEEFDNISVIECYVYGDVDDEVDVTEKQETEIIEYALENEIAGMCREMYEQDAAAESAYWDFEYHRIKDEGLL